jgi:hypothetical protein
LRERAGEAEASKLIEATIKAVMADPQIIEETIRARYGIQRT